MQNVRPDEVSSSEWRWVIIFSGLLVAATLLPYLWAFASDAPSDGWQFMGLLHNHIDGATYLSKIAQGVRGNWLFTLDYTPETHLGAAINEYYLALGHIARIFNLSPLLMFHMARLVGGFIMCISIYHLGSTIWERKRPRRLFFGLTTVGAGLGWLFILFAPNVLPYPSDMWIPESIPFYAMLVNPHFPLAIALIALLAATFIRVLRPGFTEIPTLQNGGATVILLTVLLCIVQPQGWVPIAAALIVYTALNSLMERRIVMPQAMWVSLAVLPALPFMIYYLASVNANWAMRIWNAQNVTPSPTPDRYVLGFGLLLLVALPGIWRAVRHFERDGDRFMLVWIVVNVALLYAPFNLQRRLAIALILPIVYFAVRSLEDFWFHRIHPRLRDAAMLALIVFIMPSNVLTLLIPLAGVSNPSSGLERQLLLTEEASQALRWLSDNGRDETIVLAEPIQVNLWIPAYTPLKVVYGHPYETLEASQKKQEVEAFIEGRNCQFLIDRYRVRYLVVNPVGNGAKCVAELGLAEPLQRFGSTAIYEIRPSQ